MSVSEVNRKLICLCVCVCGRVCVCHGQTDRMEMVTLLPIKADDYNGSCPPLSTGLTAPGDEHSMFPLPLPYILSNLQKIKLN